VEPAVEISPLFVLALGAAGTLLVTAGLFVYCRMVRVIAKEGGKVRQDNFGAGDLLLAGLLVVSFVSLIARGIASPPKPVRTADMVNGVMEFLVVVTFICSFLHFRRVDLVAQFGLRRISLPRAVGRGILLLLAAMPFLFAASWVSQTGLGTDAQPQEIVKFFVEASRKSNYKAIVATMGMAVICAPVMEEFIFRGYLYGVMKRYFGITGGILINASLFAAIHLSETSLAALFLLAVCFTIAYEFTGSLLVNICMHSLFNLTNLLLLLYAARHFTA